MIRALRDIPNDRLKTWSCYEKQMRESAGSRIAACLVTDPPSGRLELDLSQRNTSHLPDNVQNLTRTISPVQ